MSKNESTEPNQEKLMAASGYKYKTKDRKVHTSFKKIVIAFIVSDYRCFRIILGLGPSFRFR
jgi:hypothetical protein